MLLKLTFTLALTLVSLSVSAVQSSSLAKGTVKLPTQDQTVKAGELLQFAFDPAKSKGDEVFFQLNRLELKLSNGSALLLSQDLSNPINKSINVYFRLPTAQYFAEAAKGQKDSIDATLEVTEQHAVWAKGAAPEYKEPFHSASISLKIELGANSQ